MAVKPREQTILDQERALAAPPPLYRVLLLNDDYTPMDFVVQVLERFFHMDREQATLTMLQVHNAGAGLAGTFPKDVAQTKVNQVTEHARSHQHPLQCVMEENR